MKNRVTTAVVLAWMVVVVSGCTLRTVKTVEIGDMAQFEHSVLIATEYSDFKTAVVDGVIDALKNDRIYIKVIDVTNLKDENAEDYAAVVIVNTCMAWTLSPEVLKFMDAVPAKDRLVVLATAGDEEWSPDLKDVDAMTSASKLENTAQVTAEVVGKIQSVLSARTRG